MSALEIVAVLLGVANILLLIRRSIWNYPFGLAMVACYFVVFRDAKLYSDMWLQLFFFGVQLVGWWGWSRAQAREGDIIALTLSAGQRIAWVGGTIVAIAAWGTMIHHLYADAAYPYWDASVAMGSVAAQLLLIRRYIENWIGWIVVDIVSIGLYATKGLWLTTGLYTLFLILAWLGYREWRHHQNPAPVVHT